MAVAQPTTVLGSIPVGGRLCRSSGRCEVRRLTNRQSVSVLGGSWQDQNRRCPSTSFEVVRSVFEKYTAALPVVVDGGDTMTILESLI